jgi:hypothetical protein
MQLQDGSSLGDYRVLRDEKGTMWYNVVSNKFFGRGVEARPGEVVRETPYLSGHAL